MRLVRVMAEVAVAWVEPSWAGLLAGGWSRSRAGSGEIAGSAEEGRRDGAAGLRCCHLAAACLAGGAPGAGPGGVPVHGGLDVGTVISAVRQWEADTVAVLACPEMNGPELRELAWALEQTGTDLCLAPALLDVAGPRASLGPAGGGPPLLYLDPPALTGARQAVKSLADRLAAALALLVLAPLLAAITVAVKLADGGPVFSRQLRVGRYGCPFRMWTFRALAASSGDQAVPHRPPGGEPGMSTAAAWLRRRHLEGLPQLVNVLAGQMSLVGPRPAAPEEAARYGEVAWRRLCVRPGITGLQQGHGQPGLPHDEAVRLDLRYVENWSLILDLQILAKALAAAARPRQPAGKSPDAAGEGHPGGSG